MAGHVRGRYRYRRAPLCAGYNVGMRARNRLAKFVVGVLLLPACIGAGLAAVRALRAAAQDGHVLVPMAAGAAAWFALHWARPGWRRAYVLEHELTHSLVALVFGFKVRRIRVGADSGYAELSGSNFVVDLSPYFFPLYAACVAVLGAVAGLFCHSQWLFAASHFLLGLAYAFHLSSTLDALGTRQSDLAFNGYVFSLVVIFFGNALVLGLGLAALAPGTTLLRVAGWVVGDTAAVYAWVFRTIAEAVR